MSETNVTLTASDKFWITKERCPKCYRKIRETAESGAVTYECGSLLLVGGDVLTRSISCVIEELENTISEQELELEFYRGRKQPLEYPHNDPNACPTWHDWCHCTVEVLEHNIKRAEDAEEMVQLAAKRLTRWEKCPAESSEVGPWCDLDTTKTSCSGEPVNCWVRVFARRVQRDCLATE
jgi:hypothetical protein